MIEHNSAAVPQHQFRAGLCPEHAAAAAAGAPLPELHHPDHRGPERAALLPRHRGRALPGAAALHMDRHTPLL